MKSRSFARRGGPTAPKWIVGLGLVIAFAGLVALLYFGSLKSTPASSDNATLVLQGQSIAQGNVLLNHWNLSGDSFWTLDALFNAAAYAVIGVRPALLYLVPAIVAALVVVVGVIIARDSRKGAAAAVVAGVMAVLAVLAFPTHAMAVWYLRGGLHIATALYALVAFYALRRGQFGVGWVVAVVFLAAATLGDLLAIAYGTIPILLAGLVAMARLRSRRGGMAQMTAAVASLVLAEVVRQVAIRLGSFAEAAINPIAPWHETVINVRHLLNVGANLLGVRNALFGTGGVPGWLHALRDLTALVLVVAFILALIRLLAGVVAGRPGTAAPSAASSWSRPAWWQSEGDGWRLDDMLVIAVFGPAAMFVGLTLNVTDNSFSRYLTASVIFAAILAGRVLAGWSSHAAFGALQVAVAAATSVLVIAAIVAAGYMVSATAPPQPAGPLAALLRRHRLTQGIGDYWSASITTVQSGGATRVRPVVVGTHDHLVAYDRESEDGWFAGPFQFLVINETDPFGDVTMQTAVASWGRPAHVYTTGSFRVAVWSKPISLDAER